MPILYSILVALALCSGFYFGFILGRTNELPKFKTQKEIKQQKIEKEKKNLLEKALDNLNRYDGTSKGQEDII